MKKILIIISTISMLLLFGCESSDFNEYEKKYYVEAVLLVDEPFTDIGIFETVPVTQAYVHNEAIVKDANIRIFNDEVDLVLDYIEAEESYYAYSDADLKVQPNTTYNLEITLSDGKTITGTTTTPNRFDWVRRPPEELQYPTDTLNLPRAPESTDIIWEREENTPFYILTVKTLDTLEYGKYLDPPTEEMNRRTYSIFRDFEEAYYEKSTTNFISNTTTPIVWAAFKWFGPQTVSVYAPDFNYLQWFIQMAGFDGTTFHEPLLDSVEGIDAIGVFGSASVIRADMILLKNQP